MTVVITLIIIAVLILVHELGHFWAARRAGIQVHEFSLGFGFQLLSINKDGVEYSLRAIPLGGYVRMAGMDPDDNDNPNGFNQRRPLEKIGVAFAGPFMNFVLAALIFVISFTFIGIPKPLDTPIIGDVLEGQPAATAGLEAGDRVLTINGLEVNNWEDFVGVIQTSDEGDLLELTVQRNEEVVTLQISPVINEATNTPVIGVYSEHEFEKQGIVNSIKFGLEQTYDMTVAILGALGMLFTGGASTDDLAGPVGITMMIGDAAQGGIVYLLSFTALLSINLGILNLLPIPALDGSRIVFAVIEAIRGRPLPPEKEGFIHFIGFVLLMTLIIVVTYNDIIRWIRG
ncbi:Intramembrane protease RasP/YluC, implicated in cell division based on FtsL cleavage [Candidatus Syntrophocurvum alkaliphilum]|uniref:Zinc metalloprotease n=1 Tax=Candidatus Syntrophocurvum alkaliphilum TaxID=2293317 RepID=A0A6I6DCX6_9FIRM|nr:RIP metalloprotease RseP [Candidatus Syntrophocurvum alkaliphilum]QGT99204.1 Intramembrane protease RasP/YluC, implicated in cell division based on FtsL cleavage [Candidatus Syntrophocurvum alkaliphilum]